MQVAFFCSSHSIIHFLLYNDFLLASEWTFLAHMKFSDYGPLIWKFMQHFEWDRSTIAVEPGELGHALYDTLRVTPEYTNL